MNELPNKRYGTSDWEDFMNCTTIKEYTTKAPIATSSSFLRTYRAIALRVCRHPVVLKWAMNRGSWRWGRRRRRRFPINRRETTKSRRRFSRRDSECSSIWSRLRRHNRRRRRRRHRRYNIGDSIRTLRGRCKLIWLINKLRGIATS